MKFSVLKGHCVFAGLVLACNSRDVVATAVEVTTCETGCVCETYEGSRYMFCPAPASWAAADTICTAHAMRLARIDSAEENTWVRATANANGMGRLWFGPSDLAEEGVWRWPDGDLILLAGQNANAPGYHDFPGEEPNRGRGSNCGSMHESSSWHDQPCAYERSFVCKSTSP